MGTTFSSIHIYSTEPVALKNFTFRCFSKGWQTLWAEDEDLYDPEVTKRMAKNLSKSVNAPVLWFYEFDDEFLYLNLYLHGKLVASYSGDGTGPNKNLYQIPRLIGYTDESKRRFSRILSCTDIDFQIQLLEEFFGVCLLPFCELADQENGELARTRGDRLYKEHIAAEKKLTGNASAIQVELVQELEGLLDGADWHLEWFDKKQVRRLPCFNIHYYLYSKDKFTGTRRVPARFHNGKVQFISEEEMRCNGADKPYYRPYEGHNPDYRYETHPPKLIFSDTAPTAYRGKTVLLPRGFLKLGFDAKERLVLYDCKSTFAIVDGNTKVIAKKRLKGEIGDIDGDYILTVEERGISGIIRVYRIFDK